MNELIAALNHLLSAWLTAERGEPGRAFALSEVHLEPDGFRLVARVRYAGILGDLELRGRIEDARAGRQRIHVACERCPEHLPEPLGALRPLLETARLTLELDLRGEPAQV